MVIFIIVHIFMLEQNVIGSSATVATAFSNIHIYTDTLMYNPKDNQKDNQNEIEMYLPGTHQI